MKSKFEVIRGAIFKTCVTFLLIRYFVFDVNALGGFTLFVIFMSWGFYVQKYGVPNIGILKMMVGLSSGMGILIDKLNNAFSVEPSRTKEEKLKSSETNKLISDNLPKVENGVFAGRTIDGTPLYITSSDRACVIGPPGTGKTTYMVNQILYWLETGNSFICLDIKPEIHDLVKGELESHGYEIIVYNPTSPQDVYNFLGDLDTPESIGELASAFIPTESANNAVFTESATDLLNAIIEHIKTPTKKNPNPKPALSDVYDFITEHDTIKSLLTDLGQSNSKECRAIAKTLKIVADNERLLGSIFATFISKMRFLRFESIRNSLGHDGFSLNSLMKGKTALFLQFEESHKQTTEHFFSVMVGHILRYLIINHDRQPVLNLIDEVGNAGVIFDLVGKLNTIRSRKIPTWLYWQSTEQMQKYGEKADEGANIIMGACDLQMCFRLNDNSTAKWMSDKIGTQEVMSRSITDTGSIWSGDAGTNTTDSVSLEPIIEPHELQQLPDGVAVYTYRGFNWIGEPTPYYKEARSNQ